MKKAFWTLLSVALLSGLLLVSCGGPAVATTSSTTPQAAAGNAPTVVRFAAITESTIEQPWMTSFEQAFARVAKDAPHGLKMTLDVTENVAPPDAERILRQYAETGKYDIIWAHSSYSDSVKNLYQQYPDIAWVYTGSGNNPLGSNAYWYDDYINEPAYLAGIAAGTLTKSNKISAVGGFPYDNVDIPINAFFAGAKSVNPNVQTQVTFINSWFDPTKGKEAAAAQIAAGSDIVYAERFGPFEAAQEGGALAFGHFLDQTDLAPDVVVGSPVAMWDPSIRDIIEKWYDHTVNGTPYNAPMQRILFSFAQGGSDIAWNPAKWNAFTPDLQAKIEDTRAALLNGSLVIKQDNSQPGQ